MACGNITVGSSADCNNLPTGGTRERLVLVNVSDLNSNTAFTEDGTYRITDVNLIAGRSGYTITGFRNDIKYLTEVANPGIGLNMFLHGCGFVVYERTQAVKNELIEKVAKGRFVAFLENKGRDADALVCLGKDVGLEIVLGQIQNAHENGGFFMITLKTPEGEFESKLPQTVGTSYSNGQDILDNIIAGS